MTDTSLAAAHLVPLEPPVTGSEGSRAALVSATVLEHRVVADRYRHLRLHAPAIARRVVPGQFLMVGVSPEAEPPSAGPVLPRPMATYAWDPETGTVDVRYGVVGGGTAALARTRVDDRVTVIGPLGRGFVLGTDTRRILVVGRGVGTCSLTSVVTHARDVGIEVTAVDSARAPGLHLGRDVCAPRPGVRYLEVDDASGTSDPTALASHLRELLDGAPPGQIFICGSERLLRLCADLAGRWGSELQVAVEAHMACGLGYCHGCALPTSDVHELLVCRDGPVLRARLPSRDNV